MTDQLEPCSIPTRGDEVVVSDVVGGSGLPESTGISIAHEERSGGGHMDDEVVLHNVVGFDAVLHEDGMADGPVVDVFFYSQVVHAMDGGSPVESVVDRAPPDVAVVDHADHMVVDGVPTQLEELTSEGYFEVGEPSPSDTLVSPDHDMNTVFGKDCGVVALDEDVPGQQSHFDP